MSPRRKQTCRKPVEDVPQKLLATKAARTFSYDNDRDQSDRMSTGDNLPSKRLATKVARKNCYDPEINRVVTQNPKANIHKKPKLVHAGQATVDDDDDSSVLSASFDMHDLNEKEERAAKAERARQQRRPFPEPENMDKHQLLQQQMKRFQFESDRVPSATEWDAAAQKMEDFANQARELSKAMKQEEEATVRDGVLPQWMTNALDLTLRLQLRQVETAEQASKKAASLILKYLDGSKIFNNWKPTIDCRCQIFDLECDSESDGEACPVCDDSDCSGNCGTDESSAMPDCGCRFQYLEAVDHGYSKGYVLVVAYEPMVQLLNFAAKQNQNLKEKLQQGALTAIHSALAYLEREKEDPFKKVEGNLVAMKAMKLLLNSVSDARTYELLKRGCVQQRIMPRDELKRLPPYARDYINRGREEDAKSHPELGLKPIRDYFGREEDQVKTLYGAPSEKDAASPVPTIPAHGAAKAEEQPAEVQEEKQFRQECLVPKHC